MSFTLSVSRLSPQKVEFGYSTAHETLLALHVFYDYKHHPLHVPWVIESRKKISPALKEEIHALNVFYSKSIVSYWPVPALASPTSTLEQNMAQLMEKSLTEFAEAVLEPIWLRSVTWDEVQQDETMYAETLRLTQERYPESLAFVEYLLRDPEPCRARFAALLRAFWDACILDKWPEIEAMFQRDFALRQKQLASGGLLGLFSNLSPKSSTNVEQQKITIVGGKDRQEIDFDEHDTIYLSPSYFVWPLVFYKLSKPVIINYSIMEKHEEGRLPWPPESLLKSFRALGDHTRLQIIQFLAQKKRSTRELASLIGITDAAVSKHLKLLQDAGLIDAERDSYFVFYQLVEQAFEEIPCALSQLIKRNAT